MVYGLVDYLLKHLSRKKWYSIFRERSFLASFLSDLFILLVGFENLISTLENYYIGEWKHIILEPKYERSEIHTMFYVVPNSSSFEKPHGITEIRTIH